MPALPKTWGFDPHSGGVKPTEAVKVETERRLQRHFETLGHAAKARLEVRFRGALCYIDAYRDPEPQLIEYWHKDPALNLEEAIESYRKRPTPLGRLRHFATDRWSYAFYTYSNERYEPCTFSTQGGGWFGAPEQALEIGCIHLQD